MNGSRPAAPAGGSRTSGAGVHWPWSSRAWAPGSVVSIAWRAGTVASLCVSGRSVHRNGDPFVLQSRRSGSVWLQMRKAERTFKEQEGAGHEAGAAIRCTIRRRITSWVEVAEVGDGRTEQEVELAQPADIGGPCMAGEPVFRCEPGHGVHETRSSRLARGRFARCLQ